MYRKIGKRYEYEGDFEQYLLDIGVSDNHIEKMKEKKLQEDRNKYFWSE